MATDNHAETSYAARAAAKLPVNVIRLNLEHVRTALDQVAASAESTALRISAQGALQHLHLAREAVDRLYEQSTANRIEEVRS